MMQKTFKALSDPTRRSVLQLLRERDMTAGEIASHFDSSKPTLSRHFAVLKEAELIQGTRNGSTITYRLNVTVLEEAMLTMLQMFHVDLEGMLDGKRRQ
jgi:DNA-binding transcriptional ArsR family regulator